MLGKKLQRQRRVAAPDVRVLLRRAVAAKPDRTHPGRVDERLEGCWILAKARLEEPAIVTREALPGEVVGSREEGRDLLSGRSTAVPSVLARVLPETVWEWLVRRALPAHDSIATKGHALA